MSFTLANWACISGSMNQGQETVTPFLGVPTVLNAPNLFMYNSPTDSVATITAAGYFNSLVPNLAVGDWIEGNGTDAAFSVFVLSIVAGVVTVMSTGATIAPFAVSGNLLVSPAQTGIVAHAGGGQAAATQLSYEVNNVTVVATAADSVKLPATLVSGGLTVIVMNNGANAMQVFGFGTDTINDVATATGVSQAAGTVEMYTSPALGVWYSNEGALGAGVVVNSNVAANAAIAFSKLAALPSAQILVGSAGNVAAAVAMSGDATISNVGVLALGANKVLSSMVSPLLLKYAVVDITAAEFNGMYAVPKLLVAAGGANTLLVLDRVELLMTYGSANYAAGGVAAVQYDSTALGAGVIASSTLAAATFQAAASTGFNFNAGVVAQTFTTCVNKGLYLSNITGAFTTGDSTFKAHVWYKVVPSV